MTQATKLDALLKEVSTLLNVEAVDPDSTLVELGVDSMNVVELIMICEQLYPSVVDPDSMEFDEYTTLREMDSRLIKLAA